MFAYVLFSSSCSHGEGFITVSNINTVNNQLLSLSWGVLFFPFTFEARGEGLRKEGRLNNFLSLKMRGLILEGGLN